MTGLGQATITPGTNKKSKPAMEKRRRARINASLLELRELIPENKQRVNKMEKADILEMTVKHLKRLQETNKSLEKSSPSSKSYSLGFDECTQEVSEFLRCSSPFGNDLKNNLLNHLRKCAPHNPPDSPSSSPVKPAATNTSMTTNTTTPATTIAATYPPLKTSIADSILSRCLLSASSATCPNAPSCLINKTPIVSANVFNSPIERNNNSTPIAVSSTSDEIHEEVHMDSDEFNNENNNIEPGAIPIMENIYENPLAQTIRDDEERPFTPLDALSTRIIALAKSTGVPKSKPKYRKSLHPVTTSANKVKRDLFGAFDNKNLTKRVDLLTVSDTITNDNRKPTLYRVEDDHSDLIKVICKNLATEKKETPDIEVRTILNLDNMYLQNDSKLVALDSDCQTAISHLTHDESNPNSVSSLHMCSTSEASQNLQTANLHRNNQKSIHTFQTKIIEDNQELDNSIIFSPESNDIDLNSNSNKIQNNTPSRLQDETNKPCHQFEHNTNAFDNQGTTTVIVRNSQFEQDSLRKSISDTMKSKLEKNPTYLIPIYVQTTEPEYQQSLIQFKSPPSILTPPLTRQVEDLDLDNHYQNYQKQDYDDNNNNGYDISMTKIKLVTDFNGHDVKNTSILGRNEEIIKNSNHAKFQQTLKNQLYDTDKQCNDIYPKNHNDVFKIDSTDNFQTHRGYNDNETKHRTFLRSTSSPLARKTSLSLTIADPGSGCNSDDEFCHESGHVTSDVAGTSKDIRGWAWNYEEYSSDEDDSTTAPSDAKRSKITNCQIIRDTDGQRSRNNSFGRRCAKFRLRKGSLSQKLNAYKTFNDSPETPKMNTQMSVYGPPRDWETSNNQANLMHDDDHGNPATGTFRRRCFTYSQRPTRPLLSHVVDNEKVNSGIAISVTEIDSNSNLMEGYSCQRNRAESFGREFITARRRCATTSSKDLKPKRPIRFNRSFTNLYEEGIVIENEHNDKIKLDDMKCTFFDGDNQNQNNRLCNFSNKMTLQHNRPKSSVISTAQQFQNNMPLSMNSDRSTDNRYTQNMISSNSTHEHTSNNNICLESSMDYNYCLTNDSVREDLIKNNDVQNEYFHHNIKSETAPKMAFTSEQKTPCGFLVPSIPITSQNHKQSDDLNLKMQNEPRYSTPSNREILMCQNGSECNRGHTFTQCNSQRVDLSNLNQQSVLTDSKSGGEHFPLNLSTRSRRFSVQCVNEDASIQDRPRSQQPNALQNPDVYPSVSFSEFVQRPRSWSVSSGMSSLSLNSGGPAANIFLTSLDQEDDMWRPW